MPINLLKAGEVEFRRYVEQNLWNDIDPTVMLRRPACSEVRIGAFILDLVAANDGGGLTIVEFKVNRAKNTLAQLLLYPRALARTLQHSDRNPVSLRMVLVTPFLDRGVVDVVRSIKPPCTIVFRVAVTDNTGGCRLVDPETHDLWDQADGNTQVEISPDGSVVVRGEVLPIR